MKCNLRDTTVSRKFWEKYESSLRDKGNIKTRVNQALKIDVYKVEKN